MSSEQDILYHMWQHLLVTIRAEIDCIMMRDALRIHVHVHVHLHVHCDAGVTADTVPPEDAVRHG